MVVRIPGPDEPAPFGPPIAAPEADPLTDLPDGAKEALTRLQTRDDSVFLAISLAELTARQRASALAAEEAAARAATDPAVAAGHVDGFARRLDHGIAADIERIVEENRSLTGPKPSDEARALFVRQADDIRSRALAQNSVVEDGLRGAAQRRRLVDGIDALVRTAAAEPQSLDEALGRLADLTGAAAPLFGRDEAGALDRESRRTLAVAAARSLMAQDADAGLEAVRAGLYDDHLDEETRSRLLRDAESLSRARAFDRGLDEERQRASGTRAQEAGTLAFLNDFHRRLAADDAGHAEIATAQADGTLTAARADALRKALGQHRAARVEEEKRIGRAATILRDGGTLDSRDPDHRDLAETFFEHVIGPETEGLPAAERIGFLESLPDRIGVMPEGAACPLGGMVLAGTPADRVAAARALDTVVGRDPQARDCLPPPVLSFAEALNDLHRLRLPPETAIALAERELRARHAFQGPDDPPFRLEHPIATGDREGVKLVPLLAEDGFDAGVQPLGESDLAHLTELRSSLESAGKPDLASLLGKMLDMLRRGRSIKPPLPKPPRKEPDDAEPGPAVPRPKAPLPPVEKGDGEKAGDRPAPGPDHNGPPADSGEEGSRSGIQDVEIRLGVTVRGDPSSDLWSRFTGALDRLTGKSREAADGLVNGGELTTGSRTREHISNITRRGTLEDSLQEFNKAVERAGGTVDDIGINDGRSGTRRSYTAEDGTEFQHRVESKTGPTTVDIHIEKPQTSEGRRRRADEVKIRFEPPQGSEEAGVPAEGSGDD